jgi:hypothetical protein
MFRLIFIFLFTLINYFYSHSFDHPIKIGHFHFYYSFFKSFTFIIKKSFHLPSQFLLELFTQAYVVLITAHFTSVSHSTSPINYSFTLLHFMHSVLTAIIIFINFIIVIKFIIIAVVAMVTEVLKKGLFLKNLLIAEWHSIPLQQSSLRL